MDWVLPGARYSQNGAQLGWDSRRVDRIALRRRSRWSPRPHFSAALSLYRTELNFGRRGDNPQRSFDEAEHIGIGVAAHSWIDVAAGISRKRIESNLPLVAGLEAPVDDLYTPSATALDTGLLLRLPVAELAARASQRYFDRWVPELTVTYGIAWHNKESEGMRPAPQLEADPLPASRRRGWSLTGGLTWSDQPASLRVAGATISAEQFTPQIAGGDASGAADEAIGFELTLLETVAIRFGRYDDDDGERHIDSWGWTLQSDALRLLLNRRYGSWTSHESGLARNFHFLLNRFSFAWSQFDYGDSFGGVSHGQLRITL